MLRMPETERSNPSIKPGYVSYLLVAVCLLDVGDIDESKPNGWLGSGCVRRLSEFDAENPRREYVGVFMVRKPAGQRYGTAVISIPRLTLRSNPSKRLARSIAACGTPLANGVTVAPG